MKRQTVLAALGAAAFATALVGSVQAKRVNQCEGNACDVVSVTWSPNVGSFLVSNSSDRSVKVELHNSACGNIVPLGPHEQKYSFVKAYDLPYHANYE